MDFLQRLLRDTHLKVETAMCCSLPLWVLVGRRFGRVWSPMSEPRPIRRLHEELINKIAAGEVCLSNFIY